MNESMNSTPNTNPVSDTSVPHILDFLENLRRNAQLAKHKHFAAADRNRHYNSWFGVPVIIINLLLGSLLLASLLPGNNVISTWIGISGAILAFIAAVLSALQTLFHFQKRFESHSRIANQYLTVAREGSLIFELKFF